MAAPVADGLLALSAIPVDPSAYERERLKKIAENKAKMAGMMQGAVADFRKAVHKDKEVKRATAPPQPKRPRTLEANPQRQSGRLQGQAPINYREELRVIGADDDDADWRKKKGSKRGGGGRARGRAALDGVVPKEGGNSYLGWHPDFGIASKEAQGKAEEAALKFVEERRRAGHCISEPKFMTTSQVSGGFWSQAPTSWTRNFPQMSKCVRWLHCDNFFPRPQLSPEETEHAVGDMWRWYIVYMPERSGLSGGWRGFAIDHIIYPGDSVVLETMDDLGDAHWRVYIFRAYDYEPQEVREALLPPEARREPGEPRYGRPPCIDHQVEAAAEMGKPRGGRGRGSGSGGAAKAAGGRRKRRAESESEEEEESEGEEDEAAAQGSGEGAQGAGSQEEQAVQAVTKRGRGRPPKASQAAAAAAPKAAGAKEKKEGKGRGQAAGADEAGRGRKAAEKAKMVEEVAGGGESEEEEEEEEIFYVDFIRDYKVQKGVERFLIRWENYGPDADSWEPADCLDQAPWEYAWACDMPANMASRRADWAQKRPRLHKEIVKREEKLKGK